MLLKTILFCLYIGLVPAVFSQASPKLPADTSARYIYDASNATLGDTIKLREVDIVYFKNADQWNEYYKYRSRIEKVMPYVKVAKQMYAEIREEKENSKKRDYRHFRKDLEKEMRGKFENELKNLTVGQGEMLFKLLNRETGNNAYNIIKEIKNPFTAWIYQMIGKKYGYNLKENYDPQKEKMIELIIRQMGPAYNMNAI